MAKTIKRLLAEPDDCELCDAMFTRILEYHGDDIDASAITEAERVVLLVWNVSGIIGNGGFQYLFEGNLKGDPYFALTTEAFRATGCKRAAEAVRKTLAMFPDSLPPTDIDERLRYYLKRIKGSPTPLDMQFFKAQDDLTSCLANYIRSQADAYAHLDGAKPIRPRPRRPVPTEAALPRKKTGRTMADLPRWARVAFAARCARHVFPLLAQHWPGIPSKRADAVRLAVDLAEQSAAEGRAVKGLDDAVMNAVIVAGAAVTAQGKTAPADGYSGHIAALVAKAAEKAAASAQAGGDDSLLAAMEALDYAASALDSVEEQGAAEELEEDFLKLDRAAVRSKWTDRTKVPLEIWSTL